MPKLSGWQRIGIVVSVIWFVGFAGYVWIDSNRHSDDFHISQLKLCGDIWDTEMERAFQSKNDADKDRKLAAAHEKHKQCKDDATALFFRSAEGNREAIPLLLAIDLGTVVAGWLIVWFLVSVAKWIRRGFA
jgi:hypothetical protein